jgi:hypothetical protein
MIESYYWKKDLLDFAKKITPKNNPPRWSEGLQVNFEKDIFICFSIIRKLLDAIKFSAKIANRSIVIFQSPASTNKIHLLNSWKIYDNYDHKSEKSVKKNVRFVCNQVIHSEVMFAYREKDRNWGGIYTFSDFERSKYLYRIPLSEIIALLKLAGTDHPASMKIEYSNKKRDYVIAPQ